MGGRGPATTCPAFPYTAQAGERRLGRGIVVLLAPHIGVLVPMAFALLLDLGLVHGCAGCLPKVTLLLGGHGLYLRHGLHGGRD